ncbi:hypothetical protein PG988_000274 [Apiospora saccharicola]
MDPPQPDKSPGALVPNEKNLLVLREKFLSVFGIASLLIDEKLPPTHLQHDLSNSGEPRINMGPIAGNDFHAVSGTIPDETAWSASLRLEQEDSNAVLVQYSHIRQHPNTAKRATVIVEEAATIIRKLWPDDAKYKMNQKKYGRRFEDIEYMDYDMLSWLVSEELNDEGVAMHYFAEHVGRPIPDHGYVLNTQRQLSLKPSEPKDIRKFLPWRVIPQPAGQVWSFTAWEPWVISFPVIAGIMCLLSNPDKKPTSEYPDRDMAWCLDSLHGFCRFASPCQTTRSLSYSLGTYDDQWMYLHFIVQAYHKVEDPEATESEPVKGSGMLLERRVATVPDVGTFRERRILVVLRTATGKTKQLLPHNSKVREPCPSVVGVILSEFGHMGLETRGEFGSESGIAGDEQARGVPLFQRLVWTQVDKWYDEWETCLNGVDEVLNLKWEDLEHPTELCTSTADRPYERSQTAFNVLQLLSVFRKQIAITPQALKRVYKEWNATYGDSGTYYDKLYRFDRDTHKILLKNWAEVLDHVNQLHAKLLTQIKEKEANLRSLRADVG